MQGRRTEGRNRERNVRPTSMGDLPARLLDRPSPEVARWFALVRLHDLLIARDRLTDPDDSDALHDFRVALRRLRSLLRAFRDVLADSVSHAAKRIGNGAEAYDHNTTKKFEQLPIKLGRLNPAYFLMIATGAAPSFTAASAVAAVECCPKTDPGSGRGR